jgi:hypothetical protein
MSTERSIVLSISSPHRHPAGEQCRSHCGKLNRGHLHPGTVREQRGRIMGHELGLIIILTTREVDASVLPGRG